MRIFALILALSVSTASAQSVVSTTSVPTAGPTPCTVSIFSDGSYAGCGLALGPMSPAQMQAHYATLRLASDPPPAPPAPPTLQQQAQAIPFVAMWQIKAVLASQPSATSGKTALDDANTAVAAAPQAVQIAWANAATVAFSSPAMAGITSEIGMSQPQFWALWIAASQVQL